MATESQQVTRRSAISGAKVMKKGGEIPRHFGEGSRNTNCCLFLFDSPHQALRAEGALRRAEIPFSVVNTPREFSLHCGISLRVPSHWAKAAEQALRREGTGFREMVPYYSRFMESEGGMTS